MKILQALFGGMALVPLLPIGINIIVILYKQLTYTPRLVLVQGQGLVDQNSRYYEVLSNLQALYVLAAVMLGFGIAFGIISAIIEYRAKQA